ncbi:MAG: hypothetical protein MK033_09435 [Candidatus Caenarcaniphilales bacterium]|nr:hypothetical protein [Candidatus Caenarcaniphilales bacterium]
MSKYKLYEAGCTVCKHSVEQLSGIDNLEVINLSPGDSRVASLEKIGVKSVPALVVNDKEVLHINFGANLSALK